MSGTRLAKRRTVLERPKQCAQAIALVLEGKSDADVAAVMKVSRQAVTAFRHRHADELAPAVAEIERQIIDYAIADKVNRIAGADADYNALGAVIEARANDKRYDEPGYATGLMAHTLKVIGSGRNQEVIDEYKVDTALVAERRAIRREVAEALGQLPKTTDITIENQVSVIVREYTNGHSDS